MIYDMLRYRHILQGLIMLIIGLCISCLPAKARSAEELPEVYISNDYNEGSDVVADWCYATLDSAAASYLRYDVRAAEYWCSQAKKAIKDSTSFYYYSVLSESLMLMKGKAPASNHNIQSAITYLERTASPRATKALIIALNAGGQYDAFYDRPRAVQYFRRMGEVSNSLNLKRTYSLSVIYQAEAFARANMFVQAAQKAREAMNKCEEDNYTFGKFLCRLLLSKIYTTLKSNEMAESCFKDMEKEKAYEMNYYLTLKYLLRKVDYLMSFRKYDQALQVSDEVLRIRELVDMEVYDWKCYLQRAKVKTLLLDDAESDLYLDKSERLLEFAESFVNDERYSKFLLPLIRAHNFVIRKQYHKAKEYMDAIPYNTVLMHHLDYSDAYYTTYERIYTGTGQYKMAAYILNMHSALADSVADSHAQARESDLAYIYQTDPTILKQKAEISQRSEDAENLEYQSLFIMFAALFILLSGLILIFINRRRAQKEDENKNLMLQQRLKEEVDAQTVELRKQNDLISIRNADILRSQAYAKRIQQGLLPDSEILLQPGWFSEAMVLFKPYEITSGDFYWYSKIENRIIICAGDGAGHGIPGAMMSMVGLTLVNDVVHRIGASASASAVLTKINGRLVSMMPTFNRQIDMTVVIYDVESGMMNVSCSSQGMMYTHNDKVYPVYPKKDDGEGVFVFGDTSFKMEKGDSIYLYTDGLTSMLNGETMQKLKMVGLADIIKSSLELTQAERHSYIRQELNIWKGASVQTDDILLMGITI